MKPIILQIQKRFIEPAPIEYSFKYYNQSYYKLVGRIDYEQSSVLFKSIDSKGFILNDSQFAYWLLQNYGTGSFNIVANTKGVKGVFLFIHFELYDDYYIRTKKKQDKLTKEKEGGLREYRKLKNNLDGCNDTDKDKIERDIRDLEFRYDFDVKQKEERGCTGWLTLVSRENIPFNYQDYNVDYNEQQPTEENPFYSQSNYEETNYTEPNQEPKDDPFRIW